MCSHLCAVYQPITYIISGLIFVSQVVVRCKTAEKSIILYNHGRL